MIRRPPRSTQSRSSAASDVYKRQGQHDDGDPAPPAQRPEHVHTVDVGEAEVEDHDVRMAASGRVDGSRAGARDNHLVPLGAERDGECPGKARVVLDDQHPCHGWLLSPWRAAASVTPSGTPGSAAGARPSATGSAITTVSPPPGVSSTSMVPPIASTNPRATARPSPRPWPEGASPSRWNARKISALCTSGIPGPRSATRSTTVPSTEAALTATPVSAGEYRTAFSSTLATARSSRPSSASTSGSESGTSSVKRAPGLSLI